MGQVPALIESVGAELHRLHGRGPASEPGPSNPTPAEIRKSITPTALISFLDGKPYAMLKRHVGAHGLSFDEYKSRFSLPHDYPATAAEYSAVRREIATNTGLGHKTGRFIEQSDALKMSGVVRRPRGRPRKVPA
ncbi:MucR family transcriptional regulator [Methylobacterium currus]|uniref:MucR family transcriptional regulator n=1 Tax=Methylobacterium currus TaxID=2051553 RepID=UPI001E60B1FD|nr:MucR family transcriptional regulator [Methylobacterium currus]